MSEYNTPPPTDVMPHVESGMKEFHPLKQGEYTGRVFFLPGAAADVNTGVLNKLGSDIANISGSETSILTTRLDTIEENFIEIEMNKLAKDIEESGVTNIRLIGHSEGGLKAAVLAAILQRNGKVTVDNLGLIDSMGLYEQDSSTFFGKFNKDAMVLSPIELARNTVSNFAGNHDIEKPSDIKRKFSANTAAIPRAIKAGATVAVGLLKERLRGGRQGYKDRTANEINAMARLNPYLAELRMPVVLINGLLDPISAPAEITPDDLPDKMVLKVEEDSPREKSIRDNILPQSPDVKALYARKLGNHGLIFLRPEQVLKDMIYLMDRQLRVDKKAEQPSI